VRQDALASADVVRKFVDAAEHRAIIATTGYTARELFGAADQPTNYNGTLESTGGQCTTSTTTSFVNVHWPPDGGALLDAARREPGREDRDRDTRPTLCVVATLPRTSTVPPRATSALSAPQIHDRFSEALTQT
jgi:hypothetical protein